MKLKTWNNLHAELLAKKATQISTPLSTWIRHFDVYYTHPCVFENQVYLAEIRGRHYEDYAYFNKKPLITAYNYLVSANVLCGHKQSQETHLPSITLSALACELLLKIWHSEDEHELIPVPEFPFSSWMLYRGSNSRRNLKGVKDRHNLKSIFDALDSEIKDMHRSLYLIFGYTDLDQDLVEASDYFKNSRYFSENINKSYNKYLINNLANFFYNSWMYFLRVA